MTPKYIFYISLIFMCTVARAQGLVNDNSDLILQPIALDEFLTQSLAHAPSLKATATDTVAAKRMLLNRWDALIPDIHSQATVKFDFDLQGFLSTSINPEVNVTFTLSPDVFTPLAYWQHLYAKQLNVENLAVSNLTCYLNQLFYELTLQYNKLNILKARLRRSLERYTTASEEYAEGRENDYRLLTTRVLLEENAVEVFVQENYYRRLESFVEFLMGKLPNDKILLIPSSDANWVYFADDEEWFETLPFLRHIELVSKPSSMVSPNPLVALAHNDKDIYQHRRLSLLLGLLPKTRLSYIYSPLLTQQSANLIDDERQYGMQGRIEGMIELNVSDYFPYSALFLQSAIEAKNVVRQHIEIERLLHKQELAIQTTIRTFDTVYNIMLMHKKNYAMIQRIYENAEQQYYSNRLTIDRLFSLEMQREEIALDIVTDLSVLLYYAYGADSGVVSDTAACYISF